MKDPVTLADQLCAGLGLDPPSLDLFEMALADWLEQEWALAHDLFAHCPDALALELREIRAALLALELELGAREEWERCARVRDTRALNPWCGPAL